MHTVLCSVNHEMQGVLQEVLSLPTVVVRIRSRYQQKKDMDLPGVRGAGAGQKVRSIMKWPKKKESTLRYTLEQLNVMLASARLSEHVMDCPLCSGIEFLPGRCARYALLMSEATFPPVPVKK
jgi:hypothetical protein